MNKLHIFIPFLLFFLITLPAKSIPAKIGVTDFKQPDGSILKIKVEGNGECHFTTTMEGYLITLDNDGFYNYAEINAGKIASTNLRVSDYPEYKGYKIQNINKKEFLNHRRSTRSIDQKGLGKYQNIFPSKGEVHIPIVLVEFQDVKFSDGYPEYFRNMINGDFSLYDCPGNLQEYFEAQSQGQFTPKFDVYGPVTLSKELEYYGDNRGTGWDCFAHYIVSESAKILKNSSNVDFNLYNTNGDDEVDFIYLVYAGYSEARGAGDNYIWPHAGFIKNDGDFVMIDGLWINAYACSNELIKEGEFEGMANIIHEYSHVIGLPDLYYTGENEYHYMSPGMYSVLDYGVYANDGRTPPNFTAYERNALEWEEPFLIEKGSTVTLKEISSGEFGIIPTQNPEEFFLFENRQLTGWDKFLPNHGLLIWHIDYKRDLFENNQVNIDPFHQHVDLIEANNTPDFSLNYPDNMKGFPFPGESKNTEFTFGSTPQFITWDGMDLGLPITGIYEKDGKVIFDVAGGNPDKNDKEQDSIVSVNQSENIKSQNIYTITGIKIGSLENSNSLITLPKGLYIINGEKVSVK